MSDITEKDIHKAIEKYFEKAMEPQLAKPHWLIEYENRIRTDERNKVLSTLRKLVESDYNSKECKLLLSDLCEYLES